MLRFTFLFALWITTAAAPHCATAEEPALGTPMFVAVGYGLRCAVSYDGQTWENRHQLPEHDGDKNFLLRGATFGNGTIVAVGGSSISRVLVSRDARAWQDVSFRDNWIGDVAYGNGLFVAVGYRRAFYSTDGYTWSSAVRNDVASWRRIAFGNGRFVAVGNAGVDAPGVCATTIDGKSWTNTPVADRLTANSVACGNGRFVIVGTHGLRESSVDGVAWQRRTLGDESEELHDVIWTGTQFIAIGNRGGYASTDGIRWEPWSQKTPSRLGFGNGIFVGCSAGKFSYSTDGKNWKTATSDGTLQITKIIFVPGS